MGIAEDKGFELLVGILDEKAMYNGGVEYCFRMTMRVTKDTTCSAVVIVSAASCLSRVSQVSGLRYILIL